MKKDFERAYTSTEEVVLKLTEALEVGVLQQQSLYPKTSKSVASCQVKVLNQFIVKFVSHKVKTSLYKARAKLKNVSISNLFPSSTAATRMEATWIFLNENLTSYRRKIVNRPNEMRRDGLLLSMWTLDGTILVRTSPEGSPIKINEIEDLKRPFKSVSTMKDGSGKTCEIEYLNWRQRRTASLKGEKPSFLIFLFKYCIY